MALVSVGAVAGGPPGTVPDVTSPQIMLYVSHPIGWRGPSYNTYGLRYERISPSTSDPGARLYVPLRHRSLIDLQLTHGLSPRVLFGPRVTWDLGRSQLGPTSMLGAYPWPMSKQPIGNAPLAYWAP
jgi:hypothetical protein